MSNSVFGNTLNNNEIKIDTGLLVQKPYSRTKCLDSEMEENIDMNNQ